MATRKTPAKKPASGKAAKAAAPSRRANDKMPSIRHVKPVDKTPARRQSDWGVCAVSGKSVHADNLIALSHVRPSLAARILVDHPNLPPDARISNAVLARYRVRQVQDMLREEHGELSALEQEVATSVAEHGTISSNVEEEISDTRTFGQMLADHIATFGGSWTFIIFFFSFLGLWMAWNVVHFMGEEFDPYPFILLNLVLSCLAAIQAPIIMMSQNRQESKDRLRSEHDYQINLKAELEIRLVHEKLDHLITKQWERLTEIQNIQTELLHDLTTRGTHKRR
jgi:uncharacterized membrane protein